MAIAQLTQNSSAWVPNPVPKFFIAAGLPQTNFWTAMAWGNNAGGDGTYNDLMGISDDNEVIGCGRILSSGNKFLIGDLNSDTIGTRAIPDNTWHHYCIVVRPVGNGTRAAGYLDGTLEVASATVVPPPTPTVFRLWNTRASTTDGGGLWVGRACAFKIWNRVLRQHEIRREMGFFRPQRTEGLWAWSPAFDVGSAAKVFGGTRLASDWTLQGASYFTTVPNPPGVRWDAGRRSPSTVALLRSTAAPPVASFGLSGISTQPGRGGSAFMGEGVGV